LYLLIMDFYGLKKPLICMFLFSSHFRGGVRWGVFRKDKYVLKGLREMQ
jgi:hypothetical protein